MSATVSRVVLAVECPGNQPKLVSLPRQESIIVGRGPKAQIRIDDANCRPYEIKLHCRLGGVWYRRLGQALSPKEVFVGDRISVGASTIVVKAIIPQAENADAVDAVTTAQIDAAIHPGLYESIKKGFRHRKRALKFRTTVELLSCQHCGAVVRPHANDIELQKHEQANSIVCRYCEDLITLQSSFSDFTPCFGVRAPEEFGDLDERHWYGLEGHDNEGRRMTFWCHQVPENIIGAWQALLQTACERNAQHLLPVRNAYIQDGFGYIFCFAGGSTSLMQSVRESGPLPWFQVIQLAEQWLGLMLEYERQQWRFPIYHPLEWQVHPTLGAQLASISRFECQRLCSTGSLSPRNSVDSWWYPPEIYEANQSLGTAQFQLATLLSMIVTGVCDPELFTTDNFSDTMQSNLEVPEALAQYLVRLRNPSLSKRFPTIQDALSNLKIVRDILLDSELEY